MHYIEDAKKKFDLFLRLLYKHNEKKDNTAATIFREKAAHTARHKIDSRVNPMKNVQSAQ